MTETSEVEVIISMKSC